MCLTEPIFSDKRPLGKKDPLSRVFGQFRKIMSLVLPENGVKQVLSFNI